MPRFPFNPQFPFNPPQPPFDPFDQPQHPPHPSQEHFHPQNHPFYPPFYQPQPGPHPPQHPSNGGPSEVKPWRLKSPLEKYHTIGSWFLGPRGENADLMKEKVAFIIDKVKESRQSIWPNDPETITNSMVTSPDFNESVKLLENCLEFLGKGLAEQSIPFFSARYGGHMNTDISLPAVLGYVLAMQYNQNNVTPEASPFSSFIEWTVGRQLCQMIGYATPTKSGDPDHDAITGWGHITAGGTIANLESIWIARNLKYYPLSLHQAIQPNQPLSFVAPSFNVNLCTGEEKNFYSCTTWELLNLTPATIVEIPRGLYKQFGISADALGKQLEPFSIQTVGKDYLDDILGIRKVPQYMVSVANHYSWPKGCAITGIGRENLILLDVDEDGRMDPKGLEQKLLDCLEEQRAVYCVVAVAGTSEYGGIDNLEEVLAIRERMQQKGMTFMLHVDAARGGYFATKARPITEHTHGEYAYSFLCNKWADSQLRQLRNYDTVTLDPHKSGYVPCQAGAVCFRDGRFRFLTTWTSPYISVDDNEDLAMGIYGVEGSKPGAAPVSTYLSHVVMGLSDGGYEDLLGTAMLTSVKIYGHLATMSLTSKNLAVTPFKMLPQEKENPYITPRELRNAQMEIFTKVVNRRNDEHDHDADAMALFKDLGSDTVINAFACNFKVDGVLNTDVIEANFLNSRLYQRLSMRSTNNDLTDGPIIISRTEFKQEEFKNCLTRLKSRIGLNMGPEPLVVLSHVSSNPFPVTSQFLATIMDGFRAAAEDEIQNCLVRVQQNPDIHSFLMVGTDDIYLSYLPMFHLENYRRQLIVAGKLTPNAMQAYRNAKHNNPEAFFTIHTGSNSLNHLTTLNKILRDKQFVGDVYEGLPTIYGSAPIIKDVVFTLTSTRTEQSLQRQNFQHYPDAMPFVLFGSSKEYHIEHVLKNSPNAQLVASGIKVTTTDEAKLEDSRKYQLTFDAVVEWAMQPFTNQSPPAFFSPGATFDVTITEEGGAIESIRGKVTLPTNAGDIFKDYEHLNEEIAANIFVMVPKGLPRPRWQAKADIDKISQTLVMCFRDQSMTWMDNIPQAIGRKLPLSRDYIVKLGAPDINTVEPESHFAIVSRFSGNYPTHPAARRIADHKAWVEKFEKSEAAVFSEKR